ncbi:HDIG domain-containing protein [Candidatus Woesearchaeota archaeon]|nr:HDIG domain-containing protein [Candidatus Woesearchaeota archaeon]
MKIPSKEECLDILSKHGTPKNIVEHCKAVCKVAEETADKLISKGIKVNKPLVITAALLHDIERLKDDHMNAGADLIKKMGYPEVAEVARHHGFHSFKDEILKPHTVEQKIVFYADKRANGSAILSVDERINDLERRYKKDFSMERNFTKKIEKELLG